MERLRIIINSILIFAALSAGAAEPLSFTEWKAQQVSRQQTVADRSRSTALKAPGAATISQAKQTQAQLEQTEDLTVADYFAGYVLSFATSKENMIKIVQKLSPDENAQLLQAFAKSVSSQKEAKTNRSADRLFFE